MNINNIKHSAAIGSYVNNSTAVKSSGGQGKTDKVAIDPRNFSTKSYSATVATELSNEVSPERLSALREAVEEGNYKIPAEILADALLGKI